MPEYGDGQQLHGIPTGGASSEDPELPNPFRSPRVMLEGNERTYRRSNIAESYVCSGLKGCYASIASADCGHHEIWHEEQDDRFNDLWRKVHGIGEED